MVVGELTFIRHHLQHPHLSYHYYTHHGTMPCFCRMDEWREEVGGHDGAGMTARATLGARKEEAGKHLAGASTIISFLLGMKAAGGDTFPNAYAHHLYFGDRMTRRRTTAQPSHARCRFCAPGDCAAALSKRRWAGGRFLKQRRCASRSWACQRRQLAGMAPEEDWEEEGRGGTSWTSIYPPPQYCLFDSGVRRWGGDATGCAATPHAPPVPATMPPRIQTGGMSPHSLQRPTPPPALCASTGAQGGCSHACLHFCLCLLFTFFPLLTPLQRLP